MDAPRALAGSPSARDDTHGFLFADLRGYTRLVERHGAVAASKVLGRYRTLTRAVVAEYGGAEIKTEGDSFYVVLRSASAAVRCGLALVAVCGSPPDGGDPIEVGVGVHAGEAVSHDGGFVGSAVNIAARVCAEASVGQLLATGTVRELTRSVVDARFVPVGRRSLKGLADPVELFDVVPNTTGRPATDAPRTMTRLPAGRWPRLAVSVLGVLLALALVAVLLRPGVSPGPLSSAAAIGPSQSIGPSSPEERQSPGETAQLLPLAPVSFEVPPPPVPPGSYRPNLNRDVATIAVGDPGWFLGADQADYLRFEYATRGTRDIAGRLSLARIAVTYAGGCANDPTELIGNQPGDLIRWIQAAPQLKASAPHAVSDLGRSGVAIEATVQPLVAGSCTMRTDGIRLWQEGSTQIQMLPGKVFEIEALDDGGRTLVVVFVANDRAALSVFEIPARRLLASVVLN